MGVDTNSSVVYLQEAKEALKAVTDEKARVLKLELDVKKYEKGVKDEKKAQADQIKLTLKKRKDELSSTYDTELTRTNDKIKKINSRRDKAIAQGKKARAKTETEDLRKEIQVLNKKANAMFKEEHLPAACNSTLYYSLFFAKGGQELLVMLGVFLLVFIALPFGIYFLIPQKGIGVIVLIYVAVILLFGGAFVFISEKTKMTHPSAIKEGRSYRDAIRANKKQIKRIEKGIAKDDNNSYYDLAEYDEELDKLSVEYEEIRRKKEDAMANFENVTKQMITDEIIANSQGRIDDLAAKQVQAQRDLQIAEKQARELSLSFSDKYGAYIAKEFWQAEKLDQLIAVLNSGEAKSITEAQTVCKTKKQA